MAEARRREGQRTLRAQRTGEATPCTWAAAIASAEGERTPWEALHPRGDAATRSGHTLKRGQGQESSKPETSTSPAAACSVETAKTACGQGQGGGGEPMTRELGAQRTLKASRTSGEELSRPVRVTGELEREGTPKGTTWRFAGLF